MKQLAEYISINPDIQFGKPCIKGRRIAISDILQWLASGMSQKKIMQDYPSLTKDHLLAAFCFLCQSGSDDKNNSCLSYEVVAGCKRIIALIRSLKNSFR